VQRITVNVPATITPPSLTNPSVAYTVTNTASGSYTFSGSAKGDNPNLGPFYRGGTYTINISATGHPFYFTTDNGTNFSAGTYFGEYTSGVTGSRTDSGTITFTVPANAPDTLYYQCGNHGVMRGEITVKDLAVETNINGNYVVYFQHTQEGHATPVELRPIPSLVNQMCIVYDAGTNKFVPQDLATYVENTPSFENKIREVAGTAELVVEDGSAVIAKVNVYDDSTYLPLTGNNPGDQAFATDTDILYIWDGTAWQQAGAANSDDLTEGSTNLFFTDARADARITASNTDALSEGSNNLYYTDARADARAQLKVDALVDAAPGTLDTLNELAAALGDDPNFATTTANNIAAKLPLVGGTLTGHVNGTTFGTNLPTPVGIGGTPADLNTAEVGPGYINLARDDTADAAQIRFAKNGSLHSYIETSTNGLRFITDVGDISLQGGNVGIGTDSPDEQLHVSSGSSLNGGLIVDTISDVTQGDSVGLAFSENNTGGTTISGVVMGFNGGNTNSVNLFNQDWDINTNHFSIYTVEGTTTKNLAISIPRETGDVGIGLTSPDAKLHVNGGIIAGVADTANSNYHGLLGVRALGSGLGGYGIHYESGFENPIIWGYNAGTPGRNIRFSTMTASGDRTLGNGLTDRMVIDTNTGYVGINTSSPAEKLHVNYTGGRNTVALLGSVERGIYFTSNNAIISKGVYYNSGWYATDTEVCLVDMDDGAFNFRTKQSGNTVGQETSLTGTQDRLRIEDERVDIRASKLGLPTSASDPSNPTVGDAYYNTSDLLFKIWNGSSWVTASDKKGTTADNPFTTWGDINTGGAVPYEGLYWVQFNGMSTAREMTISPNRLGDGNKNVILIVQGDTANTPTINHWSTSNPIPFRRMIVQRTNESLTGWAVASSNQTLGTSTSGNGVSVSSAYTSDVKIITSSFAGGFGIYRNTQNACSWSTTNLGAIGAGYTGSTCNTYQWGTGNNSSAEYDNRSGNWSIWIGED